MPPPLHPRPLIRAHRIHARCRQLGRQIATDYAGGRLLVVPLLGGAFCFVADLVRTIPLHGLELRFARASSYGAGTETTGQVAVDEIPDCSGRQVLVVDDILDTGRTLRAVELALRAAGADSVRACVLLDKPARRQVDVHADYVGFTVPDRFVVGYGLDLNGHYRHLPDVCTVEQY